MLLRFISYFCIIINATNAFPAYALEFNIERALPSVRTSHPIERPAKSLQCTAQLSHGVYSLYEPIVLMLRIENRNDFAVNVDLGDDLDRNVKFTAFTPDGTVVDVSRPLPYPETVSNGEIELMKGQVLSQRYILNNWYSYDQIGMYRLRTTLTSTPFTVDGQPIACPIESIAFNVRRMDLPQLERDCKRYLGVVTGSISFAAAVDAAELLASVRHPLAIPFLRDALEQSRRVDYIIISGLENIGSEDATTVLIDTLRNADQGSARYSYTAEALSRISEKKSTSPEVIERIKKALG